MTKLTAHIFVCTNQRPPGHPRGSCKDRGSEDLVQLFKSEVAKAGLAKTVRAQRAGCLDTCEFGPAIVIYPEGVWYGNIQASDISEIVQSHLLNGVLVERLRIPGK